MQGVQEDSRAPAAPLQHYAAAPAVALRGRLAHRNAHPQHTTPSLPHQTTKTIQTQIAVEGCCHGELDKIYATLLDLQAREGRTVDLLICCGDFQAVRNLGDLETMAVPAKYRDMATFWKYYSGERVAPVPTLFSEYQTGPGASLGGGGGERGGLRRRGLSAAHNRGRTGYTPRTTI